MKFGKDIHGSQRTEPKDIGDPLTFQQVKIFTYPKNILTATGWIDTKFGADIHYSQRLNPTDFGNSLTFPLAPP